MRHLDRLPTDVAIALAEVAGQRDGIISVHELRVIGVTRGQMRANLAACRWARVGRLAVALHGGQLSQRSRWWAALIDAGPAGVLDGVSALQAAGLTGFESETIRISVPRGIRVVGHPGAVIRQTRRLIPSDRQPSGIPRVKPPIATIRAALWARSERQAALLVTMTAQQRLCRPIDLAHSLLAVRRDPRRKFLEGVVGSVLNGAQSLGELDFAALCRDRGLPEPERQAIRRSAGGTAYLDAQWPRFRVIAEIDGVQHTWANVQVTDAQRQNELVLSGDAVIRIPVLALLVDPAPFMEQLRLALIAGGCHWLAR